MRKWADAAQKETIKRLKEKDKKNGIVYQGKPKNEQSWSIGYLGELCYAKYLKSRNVKFKYEPRFDGTPDDGDIEIVREEYENLIIDVKTCSGISPEGTEHKYCMIPNWQHNTQSYPAYVGVRLNDDIAEIWGYCTKAEFEPFLKDMGIPLDKMKDVDYLTEKAVYLKP